MFHPASHLQLDTIHFGEKTMTLLQRAAYWATGRGNFKGSRVEESWTVE